MNNIKVKFCGLKTLEDVHAAAAATADAVGFVFVEKSVRYITVDAAKPLMAAARQADMLTVALFADHDADYVQHIIAESAPDILQFHGHESAEFCEQFELPYWKAVPMLACTDYLAYMAQHPKAKAYLLDAFGPNQPGGSGEVFNWFEFPAAYESRLILAGGLQAENVHVALTATGAQFVDVSSGIESSPGVKSKDKMMAFIKSIKTSKDNPNNNN